MSDILRDVGNYCRVRLADAGLGSGFLVGSLFDQQAASASAKADPTKSIVPGSAQWRNKNAPIPLTSDRGVICIMLAVTYFPAGAVSSAQRS